MRDLVVEIRERGVRGWKTRAGAEGRLSEAFTLSWGPHQPLGFILFDPARDRWYAVAVLGPNDMWAAGSLAARNIYVTNLSGQSVRATSCEIRTEGGK